MLYLDFVAQELRWPGPETFMDSSQSSNKSLVALPRQSAEGMGGVHLLPAVCGNEAAESEAVMSRELKIGMHVVFIDSHRRERDALVTAIHGDPLGRLVVPSRKAAKELTEEEKASGRWELDVHSPPIYAYEHGEDGLPVVEHREPGKHWPCINLVVISDNKEAQDQYGRQIDDRHTSVVHQGDSTAVGYCYRFADEGTNWGDMQPTIS